MDDTIAMIERCVIICMLFVCCLSVSCAYIASKRCLSLYLVTVPSPRRRYHSDGVLSSPGGANQIVFVEDPFGIEEDDNIDW